MSNYNPVYADTDSIKQASKLLLNSVYGAAAQGAKYMNRDYISVICDKYPTIIFKRNIIAVTKNGGCTDITCVGDVIFSTKEDYASVVKKIIG